MTNAPLEKLAPEQAPSAEIASLPSRLLAAALDYIVTIAIFVLVNHLNPNPDFSFLFSFLSGMFYFAIVHSRLARGQSLGKKAFGLRVLRTDGPRFLSPAQAAIRYVYYLGFVILLAELPPLLLRANSVSASPMLLEAHMLLVMCYFFCNVWTWITTDTHRALHDFLAHTIVLRGELVPDENQLADLIRRTRNSPPLLKFLARPLVVCLGSFTFAALLWSMGFSSSTELQSIGVHRYEIEHNFPVRILSLSRHEHSVTMEALLLDSAAWQSKEFAARFAQYLQEKGGLRGESLETLNLTWYRDPGATTKDSSSSKSMLRVDLQSGDVVEVESNEKAP